MQKIREVALVTGARRGIGRGIAYSLAEQGFDIVLNDLVDDDATTETLAEIEKRGAKVKLVIADVADVSKSSELCEVAWNAFGRIDHLINNAGISVSHRGDLLDVGVESYDRNLDINLRGPFFLTQFMAKRMINTESNNYRSIVFITSVSAEIASISRGEYCLSKTGLSMAAKLYALRLADLGIAVHEVRPGIIKIDMTAAYAGVFEKRISEGVSPIRRWGLPEDIGNAVAALCRGQFGFSTGAPFIVDGGLHIKTL